MLSVQPKGKQKGCAGCNRKIKDRYLLKALDQYWHEDCLKCACCDCRLGEVGSTLYTKANLILCRRDYLRWAASPAPHAPRPCQPESPLLHGWHCSALLQPPYPVYAHPGPCPAPGEWAAHPHLPGRSPVLPSPGFTTWQDTAPKASKKFPSFHEGPAPSFPGSSLLPSVAARATLVLK